jgi:hypothetical protein
MARRKAKYTERQLRINSRAFAPEDLVPFGLHSVRKLEEELQGRVVMAGDPTYNSDRQLWNPVFQYFPRVIAYCEVFNDVKLCLSFAREHGLPVTTRSGGHSTAGYSVNDGMVIDLSRIRYAVVDASKQQPRAMVGAGTTFKQLNSILNEYGLHVPGGSCEDVCVAGYMQGGGYGVTSREFGMNCDNVVEVLVMLADGKIVVANAHRNTDLFWAIRGGTGNNFGVLLQITYQLSPLGQLWGFQLQWPIAKAPAVLCEMQERLMGDEYPKLGYTNTISYAEGHGKILLMSGVYNGPSEEGRKALGSLLDHCELGGELRDQKNGTYSEINNWLFSGPYDLPDVPSVAREEKDCRYIERVLAKSDWQRIIECFVKSPPYSAIVIEPYGGRINTCRPGLKGNAFIHRSAHLDFYADVFWLSASEESKVVAWLDELFSIIEPLSNEHAYQNYPRRGNKNYRWNYWGEYFSWLLHVKRKYDPGSFFKFEQSISPDPDNMGSSVQQIQLPLPEGFSPDAIDYNVGE